MHDRQANVVVPTAKRLEIVRGRAIHTQTRTPWQGEHNPWHSSQQALLKTITLRHAAKRAMPVQNVNGAGSDCRYRSF